MPVDVADQLDLGAVDASTSAGWVSMWTIRLVPSGFQRYGAVLHEVVAHADHDVRPVEAREDVVARLEPDRHERQVRRSSIAPLPMNVAATGTWSPFANARSSSAARRRRTPFPASTIGREEPAISEAAWAIASSVGSGK